MDSAASGAGGAFQHQRTLPDRKKTASFYTNAGPAALLAALAVPEGSRGRIADLACGTGMLLAAAARRAPDARLTGCDIDAGAVRLARMQPELRGADLRVMPMGPDDSGGLRLGSLDLVADDAGGAVPDRGFDCILMNPPYVRATNHAAGRTDPVPPFAVNGICPDDQIRMGRRAARLFAGTCSHGHAGLASYFMAIAEKKVREGGTVGFILPATAVNGVSWRGVRRMLQSLYEDITVAYTNSGSLSADTGMREVMITARRRGGGLWDGGTGRVRAAMLAEIPDDPDGAAAAAARIRDAAPARIEDYAGGSGGKPHPAATTESSSAMFDYPASDDPWPANIADISLLRAAYGLAGGRFRAGPDGPECPVRMTVLGKIAVMGHDSQMLIGGMQNGPFIKKAASRPDPEFPALWGNDAGIQKTMIVRHDSELAARPGSSENDRRRLWKESASRIHMNRTADFTSQALAAAYTENPAAGGSAYPSIMTKEKYEKAVAVWLNSSFGMLGLWLAGGRQQRGRMRMSRLAALRIPIPDFTDRQAGALARAFDAHARSELMPMARLADDPARIRMDADVARIFGLAGDIGGLRERLGAEMSGGGPNG